jgi:hypothetical protein
MTDVFGQRLQQGELRPPEGLRFRLRTMPTWLLPAGTAPTGAYERTDGSQSRPRGDRA